MEQSEQDMQLGDGAIFSLLATKGRLANEKGAKQIQQKEI